MMTNNERNYKNLFIEISLENVTNIIPWINPLETDYHISLLVICHQDFLENQKRMLQNF